MEPLEKLELFSRTFENRFIFNLFDVLLCGIIVLVILRGWRAQTRVTPHRNQLLFLFGFSLLGASFATQAIFSGAFVFVRRHLPEAPFDYLFHAFQASAWLLLAASAYRRPAHHQPTLPAQLPALMFIPISLFVSTSLPGFPSKAILVVDLGNLVLLAFTFVQIYRRPLGGRYFVTGAFALLFLAASLHFMAALKWENKTSLIFWDLEQFGWSLALFVFALAIGETSRNLFDKVFVRLQIAFILLASCMILVITQTEKAEYFTSIRGRSDQLMEFVREHVDRRGGQGDPLSVIAKQEDFPNAILGLGNLPELKVVRIVADGEAATFEFADNGEVRTDLRSQALPAPVRLDSEEYFLIRALPLKAFLTGEVTFYGTREFLDQHIRRRIVLIFSLFTVMVALSTMMIGLVVRGASMTIHEQARKLEKTHQQLLQSSKLAAIGELAAGVAHEINNPATTILSLASFWLSQENGHRPAVDVEDLTEVSAQAQRIAQITGGLLAFSRPQVSEMRPVPLDRVVHVSLRLVEDLLRVNHISVEKNLPRDIPLILGDEDSLTRALENLFRNAIDAMPRGGVLSLNVQREDRWGTRVRFEVADTGVGIQSDDLARIFDPFFTTKEVGRGTGLGLSIVHGIIKEHHGTITVESYPGRGTKFAIVLPTEV